MAEPEKQIIDAITATGLFSKVRYLVAESDSQDVPTEIPLFVLSDAGRDFTIAQTFCGTSICRRDFEAVILSETAAECRSLFDACVIALIGIATVTSATDSYDDDLGAFATEINLTYY